MISHIPVYNLNAVLKETGVSADLLRAWERRYQLPKPQRSKGGHRLYSDYDIQIIKWLRSRQNEGLSISRAIDLWRELIDAGRDPIAEYAQPIASKFEAPTLTSTRVDILRNRWLEACRNFNSNQAEEVINQAFAEHSVETVCTAILQQGVSSMGEDWYAGKTAVQQEHFASALAVRRLEALISATPRPAREQTILVGCPPGEHHTLPALLLNLFIRRRGLNVIYLGADVPLEQLEDTVSATHPNLIVLSAQQLTTAATLKLTATVLHGNRVAYGGLIFNRIPQLRERIPAYYLGETIEEALLQIERLIAPPSLTVIPITVNEIQAKTAPSYRESRLRIEHALLEKIEQEKRSFQFINDANYFLGNGLYAALELGDPAYLEADLDWVKKLLTGHQISESQLIPYLSEYSQLVQAEMKDTGTPITEWIKAYIARNQSHTL